MVESKLMTEIAELQNKMINIEEKLGDKDMEISSLKEELEPVSQSNSADTLSSLEESANTAEQIDSKIKRESSL